MLFWPLCNSPQSKHVSIFFIFVWMTRAGGGNFFVGWGYHMADDNNLKNQNLNAQGGHLIQHARHEDNYE